MDPRRYKAPPLYMFLEGVGKPKTVGKNGAAAKLTNGLVVT